MALELWLPGLFPGMNEWIAAAKAGRGKSNAYSRLKRQHTQDVALRALASRLPHVPRARFSFVWHEPTQRRDPDNVSAGVKPILDGFVEGGLIPGDRWKNVVSLMHEFVVGEPGVLVRWEAV